MHGVACEAGLCGGPRYEGGFGLGWDPTAVFEVKKGELCDGHRGIIDGLDGDEVVRDGVWLYVWELGGSP